MFKKRKNIWLTAVFLHVKKLFTRILNVSLRNKNGKKKEKKSSLVMPGFQVRPLYDKKNIAQRQTWQGKPQYMAKCIIWLFLFYIVWNEKKYLRHKRKCRSLSWSSTFVTCQMSLDSDLREKQNHELISHDNLLCLPPFIITAQVLFPKTMLTKCVIHHWHYREPIQVLIIDVNW